MFLPILFVAMLAAWAPAHAETESVVALQPLGAVDPAIVRVVADRIESLYAARVTVLPERPLPAAAWYPPRRRYRGAPLLDHLARTAPESTVKVLGLTARDVSVKREPYADWGVLGVAQLDRRAAVVSTYRLGGKDASFEARARRAGHVAVHELGHTFGLEHCPSPGCVMNDARGRVRTIDTGTGEFCESCRERLGPWLRAEASIASVSRARDETGGAQFVR